MTSPVCKYCGEDVPLFKHRTESANAFSQEFLVKLVTADGLAPQYGPNGNNAFCTIKCGFHWAVKELRQRGRFDALEHQLQQAIHGLLDQDKLPAGDLRRALAELVGRK